MGPSERKAVPGDRCGKVCYVFCPFSHLLLPGHHEMSYSLLRLSTDNFMKLLDSVSLIAVIKKKKKPWQKQPKEERTSSGLTKNCDKLYVVGKATRPAGKAK